MRQELRREEARLVSRQRSVTWGRAVAGEHPSLIAEVAVEPVASPHVAPARPLSSRAPSLHPFTPAEEEIEVPTRPPDAEALAGALIPRLKERLRLSWRLCHSGYHAHELDMWTYSNWARTISTAERVHRPGSDSAIAEIIHAARRNQLSVRVAGAGGAFSPCVASEVDAPRGLLLDLSAYAEPSQPNLRIDRATCRVWVSAGWSVSKLCSRVQLQYPRLFLPSAAVGGPALTVGGAIASCAHGNAPGCGLLAESVLALRVIGADGKPRLVRDPSELRLWRCSYGLLGVITHVELQFVRLIDIQPMHRERALHVPRPGEEGEADVRAVREALGLANGDMLPSQEDAPAWREFLFNPHSGRLLRVAWRMVQEDDVASAARGIGTGAADGGDLLITMGSDSVEGTACPPGIARGLSASARRLASNRAAIPPRTYFSDVFRAPAAPPKSEEDGSDAAGTAAIVAANKEASARWSATFAETSRWTAGGCAAAVDCVLDEAAKALADPTPEPHDMVYVQRPRDSVALGYYIPIDQHGRNALAALQAVAEVARGLRESQAPVQFDLPVELSIVSAGLAGSALLSPICTVPMTPDGSSDSSGRRVNEVDATPRTSESSAAASTSGSVVTALSGIHSRKGRQLYLAIELPVLTVGGSIDGGFHATNWAAGAFATSPSTASSSVLPRDSRANPLTADSVRTAAVAEAFARVEAAWRAISPLSRPQLGCVFGLAPRPEDGTLAPFAPSAVRGAIAAEHRRLFRERMRALDPDGVFSMGREWAALLLGPEEEDSPTSRG